MFKEYIHYEDLTNSQKLEIDKFEKDTSYKYENILCSLCLGQNHKILFNNERHGIKQKTVMCDDCGLLFANPRLDYQSSQSFYNSDTYRKIYWNNKLKSENDFYNEVCMEIESYEFSPPKKVNFSKWHKNLYLDFICEEVKDFRTVFDIGCGKGIKLLDFKNLGKEVEGIEPSEILNKCHKKYQINSTKGFIGDLKGKYDLVIIAHVLEHLHNIDESIKRIQEATNKYLFVEVPGHIENIQSIQNAHNYYFSFNTLNYFIQNNKFKLIKMDYARDSEFIFALYKKTEENNFFSYDRGLEKKLIRKIKLKYQFKYFVLKILRFFKIEKLTKKIYNKIR